MTYQEIKSFINTYIVTNGVGAITAASLNTVLNALADYYGFDAVVVNTIPAGGNANAYVVGRTLYLSIPRGKDADEPFKGWFASQSQLEQEFPSAEKGNYAYVMDGTPPTSTSIWRWNGTAWADSGQDVDTSGVQSFATGEAVNQVSIIDNPNTGGSHNVWSAEQGKIIAGKLSELISMLGTYSEQTPLSNTLSYRLLKDGTVQYRYSQYWSYMKFDIDDTKSYAAIFSVVGDNNAQGDECCGVQYYDSADNFLGAEFYGYPDNIYVGEKTKLTIPAGTSYCYVQSHSNSPSALFIMVDCGRVNALDQVIEDNFEYNKTYETPWILGSTILYTSGNDNPSSYHCRTDYIDIEGETALRYSRMRTTSSSSYLGMAFYDSGKNYISGQPIVTGALDALQYNDTIISVPSNAKYARFTICGFLPISSFYVMSTKESYSGKSYTDGFVKYLRGKKISIIGDSISCFGNENMVRVGGTGNYTTPYWLVKGVDVGQPIQSYVTWLDVYTNVNNTTPTGKTIGGVTLTPAMIGTLQTFIPVTEDVGKVIGCPRWASDYTGKPWWQVLIEKSGAELCGNASWSGSCIVPIPAGHPRHDSFVLSEAYSEYTLGRLTTRDVNGNVITPDVVLIYRGTNDFVFTNPAEDLTTPDMMSFVGITDPMNFTQSYIWTIMRIREKFPKAYIVLCTLNTFKYVNYSRFPVNNGTYTLPQYNDKIREIADLMGCGLVEFDKDGITFENCYPDYISDNPTTPVHPNTNGHRIMGEKAFADIKYVFNK